MMQNSINRYILTAALMLLACVKTYSQELPVTNYTLPKTVAETPMLSAPMLADSLRWMQKIKTNGALNSYQPQQGVAGFQQTSTQENIAVWQGGMVVGGSEYDQMPGLMDRRRVEFQAVQHYAGFTFAVGLSANKYALPIDSRLTMLNMGAVQNQFVVSGLVSYDFSDNVSMTAYGQYVSNPFYHSMAALPYISTSSYGGFITLHNGDTGIDLGVNNHYDPFARRWQTDPIVRPTFKLGKKVKMSVDIGPLMKEGNLRIMGKKRSQGPMIMPDR